MSANASGSDFSLYGMLYLRHRAFTWGWILYRLWRGIVGNKLQTGIYSAEDIIWADIWFRQSVEHPVYF